MSRLVKRILSGAATIVIGVATSLTFAAPASAATYYIIESMNLRNMCMAVAGASTANGADVIQWPCNGKAEQYWYWSGKRLKNANSNKCLAVGSASKANGAELIQWTCNGGSEQNWIEEQYYWLRNENSGKYAAVAEASWARGAHIIQWPYNGSAEQAWDIQAKIIDA